MAISDRTKEFLVAALADRKAAEELIALLEGAGEGVDALNESVEDLDQRVEALEGV